MPLPCCVKLITVPCPSQFCVVPCLTKFVSWCAMSCPIKTTIVPCPCRVSPFSGLVNIPVLAQTVRCPTYTVPKSCSCWVFSCRAGTAHLTPLETSKQIKLQTMIPKVPKHPKKIIFWLSPISKVLFYGYYYAYKIIKFNYLRFTNWSILILFYIVIKPNLFL